MLRQFCEWIASQVSHIEHDGRIFLRTWNDSTGVTRFDEPEERLPDVDTRFRDGNGEPLCFSTIHSLVRFCNDVDDGSWRITIKPADGIIEAVPSTSEERMRLEHVKDGLNRVLVQLIFRNSSYHSFSYRGFLNWLKAHEGDFLTDQAYQEINSALRVLKFVDLSTCQWRDRGSFVEIEQVQMKNIESGTTRIPTDMKLNLTVGTQEFRAVHEFCLAIDSKHRDHEFTLNLLNRERIIEQFMSQCLVSIQEQIPNAVVLEGPLP